MAYMNGKRIGINAHVICDTDASYIAGHDSGYAEGHALGYNEGQKSMAVIGAVKDNPAVLDYVHPIECELAIQLESPDITDFSEVQVTRTGKNQLDLGGEDVGDWWQSGEEFKRGTYVCGISRTLVQSAGGVKNPSFDNGTVTMTTGHSYFGVGFPRKLLPNTQYTFSAKVSDPTQASLGYALCDNEGNYTEQAGSWHDDRISFTTSETGNVMLHLTPTEVNVEVTFADVLLELGDTVTEYEPYKGEQTVTANADGTVEGIMSVSPTSVLTADESVTIHAEYWLDAERKLADMETAILDLGGSI